MSLNHQIDGGAGETTTGAGAGGRQEEKKKKKPIGYGRKAKRVVLSKIKRGKKGKGDSSGNSRRRSCCFCVCVRRRIPNLDSASESPKSDPNCSEFGLDSLKGLMEKSDFLLDECNTHLDVYSDSPPHGSIHDDEW